jgi:hypothetical protein
VALAVLDGESPPTKAVSAVVSVVTMALIGPLAMALAVAPALVH